MFYGARKQVFITFGPYVLILFYGANAATISLLFAISAIVCFGTQNSKAYWAVPILVALEYLLGLGRFDLPLYLLILLLCIINIQKDI